MTRPEHDRYWPRDGPIRWRALLRGLSFQLVAAVAGLAHLAIGLLAILALASGAVGGPAGWILAVVSGAGALWQVRAWWFGRWWIVLPPLVAGALLAWLTGGLG